MPHLAHVTATLVLVGGVPDPTVDRIGRSRWAERPCGAGRALGESRSRPRPRSRRLRVTLRRVLSQRARSVRRTAGGRVRSRWCVLAVGELDIVRICRKLPGRTAKLVFEFCANWAVVSRLARARDRRGAPRAVRSRIAHCALRVFHEVSP